MIVHQHRRNPRGCHGFGAEGNDAAPEVLLRVVCLGDGVGEEAAGAVLHHCQRLVARLEGLRDGLLRRFIIVAPDILAQPVSHRLLYGLDQAPGGGFIGGPGDHPQVDAVGLGVDAEVGVLVAEIL